MKKSVITLFVAGMLLTACSEKGESLKDFIVGQWEVVEPQHTATVRSNFLAGGDFTTTIIDGADTTLQDNLQWYLRKDTLYMYEVREPGEEPGMPGMVIVEKVTDSEMHWHRPYSGSETKLKRL